jgi:putative ABC transport system permease protein
MMLQLSRQTVRHSWPPYVGALVALTGGVTLLATAVSISAAVDSSSRGAALSRAERAQLADLTSLFGIMSAVALFMAVFVVGSTFGFVVAARRRQLGLLRLVGATPRQVRLMVLGESAVVAVLAAVAGCLLALVATPAFLAVLRWRGVLVIDLTMPGPWLAWAVAAPTGIAVALLGSWRASKRAARVSPLAAFQEAGLERRRPSVWQLVIGTLCLGGTVAAVVLTRDTSPIFALVTAVLLPEVVVIGLYCFGGLVFPTLAGLVGRPFVGRDVSARLARDHVRTAVRTPVALAAPILAISAIAGSLILTLSFVADWTTALNREQLAAPYVVSTENDPSVASRLDDADLPLVDERASVTVEVGPELSAESVEAVDPATAVPARGLRAVEGDLAGLAAGGVAVSESRHTDQGTDVGDVLELRVDGKVLRPRVVAVFRDAPDLFGELVAPRSLVLPDDRDAKPDLLFVDPGDTDLARLLDGTDARVLTADQWIDEVDQQTRAANTLGLWVLLGPAGLYAGIAIVNSVMVGASQRRAQLRTIALLGATRRQLRRMALWEAGLVGAAGLLAGTAVTVLVGWTIRVATSADVPDQPFMLPWVPLGAIGATCAALTMLAALVGSRRAVRPGPR